jgi:hypothetical protein
MSHDEIPISHVNDCDRLSMSQVDEIGYALGVPLPASLASIKERVERLLKSEKELQRASEKISVLEKDASLISLLRSESLRLRRAELDALDKGRAIAAAEYAQCHISIGELATDEAKVEAHNLRVDLKDATERDAAIEEARTSKLLADESRADAAYLRTQLVDMARNLAFERAQVATIGNGASVLRGERDRALAELAEERRFTNRLVDALRGGK